MPRSSVRSLAAGLALLSCVAIPAWLFAQVTKGSVGATGPLPVVQSPQQGLWPVAAHLQTGSNVIGALTANQSVNAAQINGVAPLMGNGVTGTGSQRVTIASDNTAFAVNAAQSGTWTVQPGNTANTTAWKVDGSAVTQPVSGTVTVQTGSGTLSVDVTDRAARLVGQVEGRAASGAAKAGNPNQIAGVFNTTQPTVTTGQAVEAQATARGALIVATGVDALTITPSGTQTVAGTVTANAGTGTFTADVTDRAARLLGQVEGRAASGAAKAGNPVQTGGVFNTTQPTVTTGQVAETQATARGGLIVATGADTFNVTVNAALPTGANTIGALTANQSVNTAQIAGTATVTGGVAGLLAVGGNVANAVAATANPVPVGGVFTTTPATLLTGQTATLQFTAAQNVKHDITTVAGTAPTTVGKLDVKGADGDVFIRQATATNLNAAVVGTGTAGSPAGNILTVQGVASMTPVRVSLLNGVSGQLPCHSQATFSRNSSGIIVFGQNTLRIYVCSVIVGVSTLGAGATNFSLVEGTAALCGTGTAALIGGTTGAGGLELGHATAYSFISPFPWLSTQTAGDPICLLLGTSLPTVVGTIVYGAY